MDREELRSDLLELLEKSVGHRPETLKDEDKLREALNLDSLNLVSLVFEIQLKYGIDIPSADLATIGTAGQLLDLLQQKIAARPVAKAA
jgi:acyl carrier protein